jgi:hypothetical protein
MVSFMIGLTKSSHQKNQDLIVFSEEEQFQRILVLLKQDVPSALKLARKKLRSKKYFHCLLEEGLESADASEIETWLSYLVPCLGVRTVVNVLEGKIHEKPQQVEKTVYWLEKFVNNEKELNLFKSLEIKMLGQEYKVASSSGRVYKLILKIKSTNECVVFGGYQLGSHGNQVIAEVLDSTFNPTGGVKLVSPGDLEVLDPQPYDD